MNVLGDVEVEARVVDEDEGVGLPLEDVALAHLHITEDGAQVQKYRYEPHVGQFLVVAHEGGSSSLHEVASDATELCIVVNLFQRLYEA